MTLFRTPCMVRGFVLAFAGGVHAAELSAATRVVRDVRNDVLFR